MAGRYCYCSGTACTCEPLELVPTGIISFPQGTSRPFRCPACDGYGLRNKPAWMSADQDGWVSTGANATTYYPCKSCSGTGIIWG